VRASVEDRGLPIDDGGPPVAKKDDPKELRRVRLCKAVVVYVLALAEAGCARVVR